MFIGGWREGEDQEFALVCSNEIVRVYKWLAHEVEEYMPESPRLEELRREQNVGIRGIFFNDHDEESGEMITGFVMQASSLDQ